MNVPPAIDSASRYQRRERIRAHASQCGIDYVQIEPAEPSGGTGNWRLRLFLIPDGQASGKNNRLIENARLHHLQIQTDDQNPSRRIHLLAVEKSPEQEQLILLLHYATDGVKGVFDQSQYQLAMTCDSSADEPAFQLDPFFSHAVFSFPDSDASSTSVPSPPSELRQPEAAIEIDYLTRDYSGYRQLMLERLAALIPAREQQHPEDASTMLVELLAYAADQMSYYQDAVATEAYLGTARQRVSLRRHARLFGYEVDEGCNARVWVAFDVEGTPVELPSGTVIVSGLPSASVCLGPDVWQKLRQQHPGATVFETRHATKLYPERNTIEIYDWSARDFQLAAGTAQATLKATADALNTLQPGDVLIFEEVRSPRTGFAEDHDPLRRQAVRLLQVTPTNDPLNDEKPSLWDVTWHPDDALRFPFDVSAREGLRTVKGISQVRGNVVLADQGETIVEEQIAMDDARGTSGGQLRLSEPGLTFSAAYDHSKAKSLSASALFPQTLDDVRPSIQLEKTELVWQPCQSLLDHDGFSPAFVVEMDWSRDATLRFGDGQCGLQPRPGAEFRATYRVGGGSAGNVGRDAIRHVITTDGHISRLGNPLPASCGRDPQTADEVRAAVPKSTCHRTSCVTPEEFSARAMLHPEVREAAAEQRWSGAWWVMTLVVDRRGGRPLDDAFRNDLLHFLEPHRAAGIELNVRSPQRVPLFMKMQVVAKAGHDSKRVRRELADLFSNRRLGENRFGLFHADVTRFGETLYANRFVAHAMQVNGVRCVEILQFRRQNSVVADFVAELPLGSFELPLVENDPTSPGRGLVLIQCQNEDDFTKSGTHA